MSLGQIFNTAANMAGALHGERKPQTSLKDFLHTLTKYGVQVKSNYEIEYSGMGGLTFFVQSINVPALRMNVGNLYWKGRQMTIPVNAEQEHNFQMTVINDGTGFVYNQLRKILEIDADNAMVESDATITVTALGDLQNTSGSKFKMYGVTLTNVSGLDFSSTDSGVSTFTVDCYAARTDLQWSETKSSSGVLGVVDKISGTIGNILG